MAIISVLASLLLPAIFRAYSRVRGMTEEWEAPEIAYLLRSQARRYCGANPQFHFASKPDFVAKCGFSPKCRDWVEARTTEFVPFTFLDPTNEIVLSVHIGRRHATLYAFSKEELSARPDR